MSLQSDLAAFLSNPTVTVRILPADELQRVQERCQYLENEVLRLQSLYGQEVYLNGRLTDILQSHNIKWK